MNTEIFAISKIVSSIDQFLRFVNIEKVVCIGHSYGTLIQSCLIKRKPHLIYDKTAIFIDPVCFLIFDSHYSKNFIYHKPQTANQLCLYKFCTEDMYTNYLIERHICWYECNLWIEDIQHNQIRAHVFLSENDDIAPVDLVKDYLTKANIRTTIFPTCEHAQFIVSSMFQDDVLKVLQKLEKRLSFSSDFTLEI